MSAFCVFGVSKSVCRKAAERKQPTWERVDDKTVQLSMSEWADRRDKLAADMFEKATRRIQVSPKFDAPQFCRDWLAVDPSHVKLPVIMVRGPKVDKNGKKVMRNGVQLTTWLEFVPGGTGRAA